MKNNSNAFGFLLVDKAEGIPSFDIDRKAKRIFQTSRVGHLGTLDPFASGLLLLAIGEATKLLPLVEDGFKEYTARLVLGQERDTLDRTGTPIRSEPVPILTKAMVEERLPGFLGASKQVPPVYSAKWIDGKRAYAMAREGEEVHLQPIDIFVKEIALLSFQPEKGILDFRAVVSKGTYIRSLGADIARSLGTIGYLESLRRTRIGPFSADEAIPIEQASPSSLLPAERVLPNLKVLDLEGNLALRAVHGASLRLGETADLLLIMENGKRIAIYRKNREGLYFCYRGFAHE